MSHKTVYKCARKMPGCWVNNHSARFVDDQHILVLIINIQIHRLCQDVERFRFRYSDGHLITRLNFIIRFHRASVHDNLSVFYPLLNLGS
uniref:Uncharacterized protein n=1 Tax=Bacillus subtilis TaxID=1423 RepID=Q45481_BACIU|nr:orf-H; hypothetical protein; Method: conceptual translation supplied by author [Bacillus subtilis subsp. subtilis str. 168]